VSFSPDDNYLATGSWDTTVKIWDARTGAELRTLRGHQDVVNAVAFSPDGTRLASAGGDQIVKIWDVTAGEEALTLRGHTGYVWSLAFSADGTRLASGCGDGTVRVWDTRPWTADAAAEREAVGLLTSLFGKPLCQADVVDYLRNSPSVTTLARHKALALVEQYRTESDPERYRQAAWFLIRQPYLNAFQYQFALRQAETACRLVPQCGLYLTTLGMAQYRAVQFTAARATLAQADLLHRVAAADLALLAPHLPQALIAIWQTQPLRQLVPANLAFLAMTYHQLGQEERAQSALARVRKIASEREWANDKEVQRFLCEAETVVGGPSPVPRE
jgi:hypothetical protein